MSGVGEAQQRAAELWEYEKGDLIRELVAAEARAAELEEALHGLIRWVMQVPLIPDERVESWWNDGTARHNSWAALRVPVAEEET